MKYLLVLSLVLCLGCSKNSENRSNSDTCPTALPSSYYTVEVLSSLSPEKIIVYENGIMIFDECEATPPSRLPIVSVQKDDVTTTVKVDYFNSGDEPAEVDIKITYKESCQSDELPFIEQDNLNLNYKKSYPHGVTCAAGKASKSFIQQSPEVKNVKECVRLCNIGNLNCISFGYPVQQVTEQLLSIAQIADSGITQLVCDQTTNYSDSKISFADPADSCTKKYTYANFEWLTYMPSSFSGMVQTEGEKKVSFVNGGLFEQPSFIIKSSDMSLEAGGKIQDLLVEGKYIYWRTEFKPLKERNLQCFSIVR